MDNMFQIIPCEPIPTYTSGRPRYGRWKSLANQMRIGDSIRVDKFGYTQSLRENIGNIDKGVSKATVRKRKTDDGQVYWQVWRIA